MRDAILDIRQRLALGRYANEQSVSQGIVLRLLGLLSWPTYDTQVVIPEYVVSGRRVDFALCHPQLKPVVFVEVKQPGETAHAERQLFEYAFHLGVQLAVLTTGQEWQFFLPAGQGTYGERRVYGLDLIERSVEESDERLRRYLDYAAICSGAAIERAQHDYQDVRRSREIQRALPDAWAKLVAEENDALIGLLAERVESVCGYKPESHVVSAYLRTVVGQGGVATVPPPRPTPPRPAAPTTPAPVSPPVPINPTAPKSTKVPDSATDRGRGVEFLGNWYPGRSGSDVLVRIAQLVSDHDPLFLERFEATPRRSRKRTLIARSPEGLFPASPALAKKASSRREFRPGWWIDLNLSTGSKLMLIQHMCELAGLGYGVEVKPVLE